MESVADTIAALGGPDTQLKWNVAKGVYKKVVKPAYQRYRSQRRLNFDERGSSARAATVKARRSQTPNLKRLGDSLQGRPAKRAKSLPPSSSNRLVMGYRNRSFGGRWRARRYVRYIRAKLRFRRRKAAIQRYRSKGGMVGIRGQKYRSYKRRAAGRIPAKLMARFSRTIYKAQSTLGSGDNVDSIQTTGNSLDMNSTTGGAVSNDFVFQDKPDWWNTLYKNMYRSGVIHGAMLSVTLNHLDTDHGQDLILAIAPYHSDRSLTEPTDAQSLRAVPGIRFKTIRANSTQTHACTLKYYVKVKDFFNVKSLKGSNPVDFTNTTHRAISEFPFHIDSSDAYTPATTHLFGFQVWVCRSRWATAVTGTIAYSLRATLRHWVELYDPVVPVPS